MMPFFCIHSSQGTVATCLKRGGIFKHDFVANLLPSRLVKKLISSQSVTDGVSLSVSKSKLVYSSLIILDN